MGSNLTGSNPAATYLSILKVGTTANRELDSTLRPIEDGGGTASSLKITETGSTYGASFVGRVGIGTDTPDVQFEIEDDSSNTPVMYITNISDDADDEGGNLVFRLSDPSANLTDNDVVGDISFYGQDNSDDAYINAAMIRARINGTPGTNDMPGELAFYTNAGADAVSQRMCILANGFVGINVATPLYQLHVADDPDNDGAVVQFSNSHSTIDNGDIVLSLGFSGDADATAGHFIQFHDSDTANMGAIVADSGTASAADHSDYRSKENIALMSSGLSEVNNLKPSTFNFKGHSKTHSGFIAHEVQDIIPGAVYGAKDAVNADGSIQAQLLSTQKLIPFMVKAIQELSAKVTALESA